METEPGVLHKQRRETCSKQQKQSNIRQHPRSEGNGARERGLHEPAGPVAAHTALSSPLIRQLFPTAASSTEPSSDSSSSSISSPPTRAIFYAGCSAGAPADASPSAEMLFFNADGRPPISSTLAILRLGRLKMQFFLRRANFNLHSKSVNLKLLM